MNKKITLIVVLFFSGAALAQDPWLPNPTLTPGVRNPEVTQATIEQTICQKGWTKTIRPDVEYTNHLKRKQMRQYGYLDLASKDYEEDHFLALEIGGSPDDPRNLWPQPRQGEWTAGDKDKLETALKHRVCKGKLTLEQAQQMMLSDWTVAFTKLRLRHGD